MQFDRVRQWSGSAKALTEEIQYQIGLLNILVEPPALRTIRLWRSKKLLSQPKGKKFGLRQILEGLATALLLKRGWTLSAIGEVLPNFSDSDIERQILAESENRDPNWSAAIAQKHSFTANPRKITDIAEDAVVLLAQGILKQYTRVLNQEIVRQDDSMPSELYRAMGKLGRLYIEEGLPDKAACVHSVLDSARHSFSSKAWQLEVFRQNDFRFSDVILIDPDLYVPTSDCAEIAQANGGWGEDNVVEYRLYQRLKTYTEQLGARKQHFGYTALRELTVRHSLIKEKALWDYLEDHQLLPLQERIIDLFDQIPESWLIEGKAYRCAHCGTLMHPHPNEQRFKVGRCPIRQCNSRYAPKVSEAIDPQQHRLLIAKPQILTYWTGPGIDELAIFDAAKKQGLKAELYPESDLCDVSLYEYEIGIDAKSYISPVSLALRLNQSMGGLGYYQRRIIAISDQLIADNPSYLSVLQSTLANKGDPATLEVLSVSAVLKLLKEVAYAS